MNPAATHATDATATAAASNTGEANAKSNTLQSFQIQPGALLYLPPRPQIEAARKEAGRERGNWHGLTRVDGNGHVVYSSRVFGQVVLVLDREGGDGEKVRVVVVRKFGDLLERVREVKEHERKFFVGVRLRRGEGGFWYVYVKEVFEMEWEFARRVVGEEDKGGGLPLVLLDGGSFKRVKGLVGRFAQPTVLKKKEWKASPAEKRAWWALLREMHMKRMKACWEEKRYAAALSEGFRVLCNLHLDLVSFGILMWVWGLVGARFGVQVAWNGLLVWEFVVFFVLAKITELMGKVDGVYIWMDERLVRCQRERQKRMEL